MPEDEAKTADFIQYLKCDLPEGYPLDPPLTWPMTEPLKDAQRQDLAYTEVSLLVQAEEASLKQPAAGYLAAVKHQMLFEIIPAASLVYALVNWQKVFNDAQQRWRELQRETRGEIDDAAAHFCERLANLQRNAGRIAAAEKTLGVALKAGFTALEPMPPKPAETKTGLLGGIFSKKPAEDEAMKAWHRQDSFQQLCEKALNLIKTLPPEVKLNGLRDLPATLKVLADLREERAALENTYITKLLGR